MRKIIKKKKITLNKRIIFILIFNFILLLLGLLYPSLINKDIISNKLTLYIENLINGGHSIDSLIKTNIINNLFENTSFYLFTGLLFPFPLSIIIYFLKPFSIGVSISSIIYIYGIKGALYSFVIIVPSIINLFILTLSFYYSLSYFIIMVRYKRSISKKRLLKGYIKVFIFTTILQVFMSFVDAYLSYYLFRFM